MLGEEVRHVYVTPGRDRRCRNPRPLCLHFCDLCREKGSSALYFSYNTQLGPPYHILLGAGPRMETQAPLLLYLASRERPCVLAADTNFINFSIQNKLDVIEAAMNCLFAKCIPCVTDW